MNKLIVKLLRPNKVKVIRKLINKYEYVINRLKTERLDLVAVSNIVYDANLDRGICKAARCMGFDNFGNERWVKRNISPGTDYWIKPVSEAILYSKDYQKTQVISLLQYRLCVLKQELKRL